jgi:hypothetical protein
MIPIDVLLTQRISDVWPSTRSGPRPSRVTDFATVSFAEPSRAVALSGRLISQSVSCASTLPVALAMELGRAVPVMTGGGGGGGGGGGLATSNSSRADSTHTPLTYCWAMSV